MMEEEGQEYLIPRNVDTRFMFIPGFGWKELFISLIGLGIGLMLFFTVTIFVQSMLNVVLVIVPTVFAVMLTISDPKTGVSFMQLIKDFKEFNMSVRKYYYRYGSG